MYYTAKLKKKSKLFQKPYIADKNYIYITDTERCKKRFLKSGIKNVVFKEEFLAEDLFSGKLCEVKAYDRNFILNYTKGMIEETVKLLKLSVPLSEIAIFSHDGEAIIEACSEFTRLITLVGERGEDYLKNGVPVRRWKKIKTIPSLFIIDDIKREVSPVLKTPVIDLRENPISGQYSLAWNKASFKTDLFDFDIGMDALIYFLKKGEVSEFRVTSLRKKCPRIFTFS